MMNSLDFAMKHSCQVLKDTGTTQDDVGSPIHNYISTTYKCLFSKVSTSGNYISSGEVGKVITSSHMVFLPADAVVEEGDMISTDEAHWAGTYEVQNVDAPIIPSTGVVDHIEAFLKVVKKRG